MWSDAITLTLTIDGDAISGSVIAGASWQSGRTDWFASLSPGTATFTLRGDLTGSIACGDSLVLTRGADTLWTGKVASVTLSRVPRRVGETLDETIVTGADLVAQLGEATIKSASLGGGDFPNQLDEVLTAAGVAATIERAPGAYGTGSLDTYTYSGTVLDYINDTERYTNCATSVNPGGSIVICYRGRYPDYGERVFAELGGGDDSIPDASSLWRMDESVGDPLDSGPSLRDGVISGTVTHSLEGPWGPDGPDAMGFQKADAADHVSFGDIFDLAVASFTLAGWVRCDRSGADAHTVAHKQDASGDGWRVEISTGGALRFQAGSGGSSVCDVSTSAGAIPTDDWAHWCVVRSGATVTLYVDGTQAASGAISGGALPNLSTGLRLARGFGGSLWYGGRMCMVSVWVSALTAAQVHRLIWLDHVELPEPRTWSETTSITSVINHWVFGSGTAKSDASITKYGRRSWDVSTERSTDGIDDVYRVGLRGVMYDPRPIATATYSVTDGSSDLITISPLTLARYDSVWWQVVQVQHVITPSTWDVTLTLDRTQNDMTATAGSLLPV